MQPRFIKIGDTFHEWTVIEGPFPKHNRITHWKCRCTCGTVKDIAQYNLLNDRTHNCGKHRVVSEDTRAKLSKAREGQGAPWRVGQRHTQEATDKMAAAHRKRHAAKKALEKQP